MPAPPQPRAPTRSPDMPRDPTLRGRSRRADLSALRTVTGSLHSGGGGETIELGIAAIDCAIDAFHAGRSAIEVGEDRNEIAARKGSRVAASQICEGFHGCFLAAEAIEAATSVAILIWGSRSVS